MKPSTIEFISEKKQLNICWDDGSEHHFPVEILRGFCPCAGCQGHSAGLPKFMEKQSDRALQIENVTPVGNYGMCVIWADGHDTGIYSFKSLQRFDLEHYKTHPPEDQKRLRLLAPK